MRFKLLSSLIASASLVATPVLAQAAPSASATKLSVARANTSVEGKKLAEGAGGIVAIALVAGIIAIGVLAATQSDGDSDSN